MCPSELKFDKLKVWARVVNLPFNLRNESWCKAIAKQIDKEASSIHFDHGGGCLRARVTLDVAKPLRRWILINSARRGTTDPYDIQYENIPHFCFLCGRLGHSDLYCPTPGVRDEHGDLPFGKGLRAPDERHRPESNESAPRDQYRAHNGKADTHNSSSAADGGTEVNSPVKQNTNQNKRKGGPQGPKQVYRRVEMPLLMDTAHNDTDPRRSEGELSTGTSSDSGDGVLRDAKKKKPTPSNSDNSAAVASQPCPSQ